MPQSVGSRFEALPHEIQAEIYKYTTSSEIKSDITNLLRTSKTVFRQALPQLYEMIPYTIKLEVNHPLKTINKLVKNGTEHKQRNLRDVQFSPAKQIRTLIIITGGDHAHLPRKVASTRPYLAKVDFARVGYFGTRNLPCIMALLKPHFPLLRNLVIRAPSVSDFLDDDNALHSYIAKPLASLTNIHSVAFETESMAYERQKFVQIEGVKKQWYNWTAGIHHKFVRYLGRDGRPFRCGYLAVWSSIQSQKPGSEYDASVMMGPFLERTAEAAMKKEMETREEDYLTLRLRGVPNRLDSLKLNKSGGA